MTNVKVLRLGRQGGSDVFGITCHYQLIVKEPDLNGVDIFADCIHGVDNILGTPFFLVGFEALNECTEAEGIFARHVRNRAAAPAGGFGMKFSLREGRGYEFVSDIENKTACETKGNGRHCKKGRIDGETKMDCVPVKSLHRTRRNIGEGVDAEMQ